MSKLDSTCCEHEDWRRCYISWVKLMTLGTMDGKATVDLPSVTVVRQVKLKYNTWIYYRIYYADLRLCVFHSNLTSLVINYFSCCFPCVISGGLRQRLGGWQEVTCHPETRDHCRDMPTRHCHGDRGSHCWCQVLLGQHHWNRQGISHHAANTIAFSCHSENIRLNVDVWVVVLNHLTAASQNALLIVHLYVLYLHLLFCPT